MIIFLLSACHLVQPATIIRGYRGLPIHFAIAVALICIYLFKMERSWFRSAGRLYEASDQFKRIFLLSQDKNLRSVGRSIQPLCLRVGSFYIVKASTWTTLFSIMSNYTVMLLLYKYWALQDLRISFRVNILSAKARRDESSSLERINHELVTKVVGMHKIEN
jgi:hypothetical protein